MHTYDIKVTAGPDTQIETYKDGEKIDSFPPDSPFHVPVLTTIFSTNGGKISDTAMTIALPEIAKAFPISESQRVVNSILKSF